MKELARQLRIRTVEEWKKNPNEYQRYIYSEPVCSAEEEANKFMQDGYYYGDLANTMAFAMANYLQIPIVIFSLGLHNPIIFVTPKLIVVNISLIHNMGRDITVELLMHMHKPV